MHHKGGPAPGDASPTAGEGQVKAVPGGPSPPAPEPGELQPSVKRQRVLPLTYCLSNFRPEVAKVSNPNLILMFDLGAEMPGSVQGCGHLCLGLTSPPRPG